MEVRLSMSLLNGDQHVHYDGLQSLLKLSCYKGDVCCEEGLRVDMLYLLGLGRRRMITVGRFLVGFHGLDYEIRTGR